MLATMYGAPDCLRYCEDCRRTTSMVLDHATGRAVCTECALQLGDHLVERSSDRRRASSGSRSAGDDPLLRGQLAAGASLSAPLKLQAGAGPVPRMRGATPAPNKALAEGFSAIAGLASRLELAPSVGDRAKEVLRKLEDAKACPKGRSRDALYAACLQAACRREGSPRTLKELVSVTADAAATRKDIGKFINVIKKVVGSEEDGQASDKAAGVVRAVDYLHRYGSALGMSSEDVGAAQDAAGRLEESLDVRRNPQSVAAGLIYMALQRSGDRKTVRDVSAATGVSESTVKEAYRDLCPHAELLFGYRNTTPCT